MGSSLELPALIGDYETDVIEVCSLLGDVSAGDFVLSGFGRDPWPLDVGYDMSAFMECFPDLLASVRMGRAVEVDLYSQGVESSLIFRPVDALVEIRCVSRTSWLPIPDIEWSTQVELLGMLERLGTQIAMSLHGISPELASNEPFAQWLRGVFEDHGKGDTDPSRRG